MPKHFRLTALLLLAFAANAAAQSEIDLTWDMLADLTTEKVHDEEYDLDFDKPTFGDELLALSMSNQDVVITGYLLPMDVQGNQYILSKFPFAACFFCSKGAAAGPETVVELRLSQKYDWFRVDDVLTFKGKLRLNDSDVNQLYYMLEDAEVTD